MTTALIVPFGAGDTETGRARQAIWNLCYRLWASVNDGWQGAVLAEPHHLIVAGDPLFGAPVQPFEFRKVDDRPVAHPFSVARAVNRAVRLSPPEVDKFVCIGADALPDWRVVDWAAAELKSRPWTLLFGKGANLDPVTTQHFAAGEWSPEASYLDAQPFETPCVGPIAFTREAFMAVRGFDERFEGWGYEDVDLWSRLRQYWPADDAVNARTSPYPLIQFSHPIEHHDLTDANPNVRLWKAKCAAPSTNDHPAEQLFGVDR